MVDLGLLKPLALFSLTLYEKALPEIEISVLSRQCLDRRIPDQETLIHEIALWEEQRNAQKTTIDWRFSAADARVKLQHSYPVLPHQT